MTPAAVALKRLYQQRLTHNPFATPEEAVTWLVAVQAQEYQAAKWALGLRTRDATDAMIERAFTEGTILRTHVMRPTWHFVTPADIRWLLQLTASRVNMKLVTMDRRLELDKALLRRSYEIIAGVLRGGQQLTRAELGSALAHAGIEAEGLRLTHIVMHAELEALLCSGPRRGKQFTYMLLDERAAQVKAWHRDEAVVELVRRYYTGHGPATVHDFAWWSGLTVADARAGLAMIGSALIQEKIDGQTYFFSASMAPAVDPGQVAFLLPTYDEFLVGFAGFDQARRGGHEPTRNGVFDPSLIIGGQVKGTWKRTLTKAAVTVELAPFTPLSAAESELINSAAQRYGKFLGLPMTVLNG